MNGSEMSERALSSRVPAQAVIGELLEVRERDALRSFLGRLLGTDPLSPESRPWFRGALGEIAVGRILARLEPEWTVLHAVPVGKGDSDIDHVLIGPGGVFTLNTANHSGQPIWVAGRTLMVAGKKQRHIPNAVHEAARAEKLLTGALGEAVEVTGVLVLVEPKSFAVREKPADVAVLTSRQLLRWLNRRGQVLTLEQITAITAVAVMPATWHRNPAPGTDPGTLVQEFNLLRTLVDSARRRRAAWALALCAALLLVLANVPAVAGALMQTLMHR